MPLLISCCQFVVNVLTGQNQHALTRFVAYYFIVHAAYRSYFQTNCLPLHRKKTKEKNK